MNEPLQRLYRTKLALLATICMVVGAALLVFRLVAADVWDWQWLQVVPLGEIGSALFTTGLVAVAFEYLDREDSEQRAIQRLRKALPEQATILRSAVIEGFAASPDSLAAVASPATLDRVAENCLSIQLGDEALAHDVYADLRQQVIRTRERWHDVRVSVAMAPWTDGPAAGDGSMFVATIRWEYRTMLADLVMRFYCVSDLDEYRALIADPLSTQAWYFEPIGHLDAASETTFELVEVSVNGRDQRFRRSKRTTSQSYVATIKPEHGVSSPDEQVHVSYTYRVLVQRHSHMLQLDIAKPSKGLRVEFWYGGFEIQHVNVLDFISSAEQPRIARSVDASPSPMASIAFDGWVFPKSGVAFVWVLAKETAHRR
jgi:hypothetical protein